MNGNLSNHRIKQLAELTGALKGITCCLVSRDIATCNRVDAETDWPEMQGKGAITFVDARTYLHDVMAKCIEILDRETAHDRD